MMGAAPVGSLTDVLPSALSLLGLPDAQDRLGLSRLLGPVRQLAVLLVDGLGHRLLPAAAEQAPILADALAGADGTALLELSCCFPSTTPTSLVSFGTGALPGAHGVLGFTVNVPGTDRVLVHIAWQDDPDPAAWQPVPSLFDRALAAGISSTVVARSAFAGSGLTRSAYGSAPHRGADTSAALAEQMLAQLLAGTRLVYGYHPTVDTMAHRFGIDSAQWRKATGSVDRLISRIVDGLPPGTALLVTADHGGIDVPEQGRIDVGTDPRLAAGVRVVAGEPRVRYLHTAAGARTDVLDTWRGVLGAAALVLERDEAIAQGCFGPVPDVHRERIGDVVVICRGQTVVLASGYEPPSVAGLVAFHGSNTPAETAIPLLVYRPR
jgi:hypothetical protein